MATNSRCFVFGISGATWTVIEPLLRAGRLPNLASFKNAGCSGTLESVKARGDKHYRPQTAWPSLNSGLLPEHHGVEKFFHTRRNLRCASIWDYFSNQGFRVGLYELPVLWPPPSLNGFVIPSPYARDEQTTPPELSYIRSFQRHHQKSKSDVRYLASLQKLLKQIPMLLHEAGNLRIVLRMFPPALRLLMTRDAEIKALILRKLKLDYSTAVFASLYKRFQPDLSIFTNFVVDYVSHRYWRYYEADRFRQVRSDLPGELRRGLESTYEHMDQCIGDLCRRLPPDTVVAIVSEHGMAAEPDSAEVGAWQYAIRGDRLIAFGEFDADIIAVPLARWIAMRRGGGEKIDADVVEAIEAIVVAETDRPLFKVDAHVDDEVVVKLDLPRECYGDVEDIGALHFRCRGRVHSLTEILRRVGPTRSAMHHKDGILLIKGPGIRCGQSIEGARIVDVMPTLLRAAGIEIPDGLDGRVLEIFTSPGRGSAAS